MEGSYPVSAALQWHNGLQLAQSRATRHMKRLKTEFLMKPLNETY